VRQVQFAKAAPETIAVVWLLKSFWSDSFFNALRTDQQLGYIVNSWSSVDGRDSTTSFNFAIQSGKYKAEILAERAGQWIDGQLIKLKDLPLDRFEYAKNALVDKLSQPVQSMAQAYSRKNDFIFDWHGDFSIREKIISAIGSLSRERFISSVEAAFQSENIRQISAYIYPKGQSPSQVLAEEEDVSDEISSLKKTFEIIQ